MALLTADDIARAVRIRKLLAKAHDPGATGPERDAFLAGAQRFARTYRYGDRMLWDGKPVVTSGDD